MLTKIVVRLIGIRKSEWGKDERAQPSFPQGWKEACVGQTKRKGLESWTRLINHGPDSHPRWNPRNNRDRAFSSALNPKLIFGSWETGFGEGREGKGLE